MNTFDTPADDAGPSPPAAEYVDHAEPATDFQQDNPSQEVIAHAAGEAEPSGADEDGCAPPDEAVGVAAGRARKVTQIKAKGDSGKIVWAKMGKFPWWPAQVLAEKDPFIPKKDAEPPRRGAVPVRFFGTHDFAWIESQRALCGFGEESQEELARQSTAEDFTQAVDEAVRFAETGELPAGFSLESTPPKGRRGKGSAKEAVGKGGRKGAKGSALGASKYKVRRRKQNVLQALALAPPKDSPFRDTYCLAGAMQIVLP